MLFLLSVRKSVRAQPNLFRIFFCYINKVFNDDTRRNSFNFRMVSKCFPLWKQINIRTFQVYYGEYFYPERFLLSYHAEHKQKYSKSMRLVTIKKHTFCNKIIKDPSIFDPVGHYGKESPKVSLQSTTYLFERSYRIFV